MPMTSTCLIRVDGDARIGSGHVMRCLALAHACRDAGGQAVFAMATPAAALQARLAAEAIPLKYRAVTPGSSDDAAWTASLAGEIGARWVVVDGYAFQSDYVRRVRAHGFCLVSVDDTGLGDAHVADVVVNQNFHAHEGLYDRRAPYTTLLLGPRYVLLRREFLASRTHRPEVRSAARRILVTFGGSDPMNVSTTVIRMLPSLKVEALEAMVIVGGNNPRRRELEEAAGRSRAAIRVVTDIRDMPEAMAWADVAVSAGGSTCWELAFMGIPIVAVAVAENQRPIAASLERAGVGIDAGWHAELAPDRLAATVSAVIGDAAQRQRMSAAGRALIDGQGAARVLACLQREPATSALA